MKIIKLIQKQKEMDEKFIEDFIKKNFPQELINGLEYDDPNAIRRAMKMLGLHYTSEEQHADAS